MPKARWMMVAAALSIACPAGAGTIRLKDGVVYRGDILRENTIYTVFDGLTRVIIRDNRIEKVDMAGALETLERIKVDQPLEVHAGQMPVYAIAVKASPWDEQGRRLFNYYGQPSKSKGSTKISMSQAINELYPDHVRIRGITGFWQGQVAIGQVPKQVILGLLSTVDKTDVNQRLSVAKFMIQAEWYDEALPALDEIAKDFPDQAEKITNVQKSIREWSAALKLGEIQLQIKAHQPRAALAALKIFPTSHASAADLAEVRKRIKELEDEKTIDRALAESIRDLGEQIPEARREFWKVPLVEVLKGLSDAGEAVRPRLAAFEKASTDPKTTVETKFALALSGWVSGSDNAVTSLEAAEALWNARSLIRDYTRNPDGEAHSQTIEKLKALNFGLPSQGAVPTLESLTRIVQLMTPPLANEQSPPPTGQARTHRVLEDESPVPTEYSVLLPPEYHPARSYPAVVAIHPGAGPTSAIEWWRHEAQRRGYIVVAPEYNLPDKKGTYTYSTSEHAAVILSLRDALKRYSIDSDRVFIGGQLTGADMALDFGLGHPDLFAGIVAVSGGPVKYVFATKQHAKWIPVYSVAGDLAPYLQEVLFPTIKGMMQKYPDVTYVEYFQRGMEDFPEEAKRIFDWMDPRRRDPFPKAFEAVAARECDNRYFGIAIDEFLSGRTIAPEAVDPVGKNLHPASIEFHQSTLGNLLNIKAVGLKRFHVWVSPKLIDFNRRMEVRVNNQAFFKGTADPSVKDFLDDLRIRGDRKQIYWLKVTRGMAAPRDRRAGGDQGRPRPRS